MKERRGRDEGDDGHVVGLREAQQESVGEREERGGGELGNDEVGGAFDGPGREHAVGVV